jgi:methane monooxygenase component C
LEFLIRILDDGKFSNFLKNGAKVGQTINVKGPSGIFGLVANGFTPRYFVAGGTGLAPIQYPLYPSIDPKKSGQYI